MVVHHLTESQPEREILTTIVILPYRGGFEERRNTWGRVNLLGVSLRIVKRIIAKK
jgi:hypothetical protein